MFKKPYEQTNVADYIVRCSIQWLVQMTCAEGLVRKWGIAAGLSVGT